MNHEHPNTVRIFRCFTFSLSSFDYFKEFQRAYEDRHNVRLSNNQALAILLGEHQKFTTGSAA